MTDKTKVTKVDVTKEPHQFVITGKVVPLDKRGNPPVTTSGKVIKELEKVLDVTVSVNGDTLEVRDTLTGKLLAGVK